MESKPPPPCPSPRRLPPCSFLTCVLPCAAEPGTGPGQVGLPGGRCLGARAAVRTGRLRAGLPVHARGRVLPFTCSALSSHPKISVRKFICCACTAPSGAVPTQPGPPPGQSRGARAHSPTGWQLQGWCPLGGRWHGLQLRSRSVCVGQKGRSGVRGLGAGWGLRQRGSGLVGPAGKAQAGLGVAVGPTIRELGQAQTHGRLLGRGRSHARLPALWTPQKLCLCSQAAQERVAASFPR